jgi:hypothetical protein
MAMRLTPHVALIGGLAVATALLSEPARSQTAKPTAAAAPQILRPTIANKKQFDRQLKTLPDSTVVESEGKRLTVGEIKARSTEIQRKAVANAEAGARSAAERSAARAAQFERRKMAKLDADKAKGTVELGRISQFEAIRKEAAQMMERSKTATPAQMNEMNQRAQQLLRQLNTVATTTKG